MRRQRRLLSVRRWYSSEARPRSTSSFIMVFFATPFMRTVALTDLQSKRDALLQVVQGLDLAIEGLSRMAGAAPGMPSPSSISPAKNQPVIRSDTFFRMTVADAAERYLGMMAEPRSTQVITEA